MPFVGHEPGTEDILADLARGSIHGESLLARLLLFRGGAARYLALHVGLLASSAGSFALLRLVRSRRI